MAVAGDILIKVAADLAEFTKGMTEAAERLNKFGEHAKHTGDRVEGFISLVKGAFVALGIEQAIQRMLEYAEQVQKTTAQIELQSKVLGVTTDQLQAYQVAAIESGQSQDAITAAILKFNRAIGEAQLGGKAQIETLDRLGIKILDVNGKLRPQSDLLAEVAQRLLKLPEGAQRAAAEVALFGRAGQEVNPILQKLAEGADNLIARAKSLGVVIDEDVIKQMEALEIKGEIAQRRVAALIAPIYAEAKTTLLGAVATWLEETVDQFRALATYDSTIDKLIEIMRIAFGGAGAINGQTAMDATVRQIETATATIERLEAVISAYDKTGTKVTENIRTQLDAAYHERDRAQALQDRLTKEGLQANLVGTTTLPAVTTTGTRNPAIAGVGQATEDAIKRLQLEADAANKAFATLQAGFDQPLDQVKRAVDLQKQIDDMVAKLGSKKEATGYVDQLRAAATAADTARAAFARLQQDEAAADATQRKLGDGSAAYVKVLDDLNRQLATKRLSDVAFTRALKEQTEAINIATLAAKRYDDNLGSLTAGFEEAAVRYARANDLFSQGGALFNGLVTAMDEGLASLSGRSTKTFGQIAADFAVMLEQMALKAAASAVFGAIFGSATGMAGAGQPGSPYFGPVAPGGGGGLMSWLGGLFGGAHATGGPVYPGMSYDVGESGPERFVPTVAGQIVPAGLGGSSGGVTVNLAMGQTQGARNPTAALEFGRRVRAAVVDVIATEKRPGGTLYAGHNA